jgi:hypothetical protein
MPKQTMTYQEQQCQFGQLAASCEMARRQSADDEEEQRQALYAWCEAVKVFWQVAERHHWHECCRRRFAEDIARVSP